MILFEAERTGWKTLSESRLQTLSIQQYGRTNEIETQLKCQDKKRRKNQGGVLRYLKF